MKSNVKGHNRIVVKPKVTEQDRLSVTSKVTESNHRSKGDQSTVFLSAVDCAKKKDAWLVTLKVKLMRFRFKNRHRSRRHDNNKEDMVGNERQTETRTNSCPSQQC